MADRLDVVVVGVREASHARTVQLAAELARLSGLSSSRVQVALLQGEMVVHRGFPSMEAERAANALRGLGAMVELRASTLQGGPRLEPDVQSRPTREMRIAPAGTALDLLEPDPEGLTARAPPPPAVGVPTAHVPLAPPPDFATLGPSTDGDSELDADDSGAAPIPTFAQKTTTRTRSMSDPLLDPSRPQGRPEHAEERPFDGGAHRRSSRPTPSRVEPLPEPPRKSRSRPTPSHVDVHPRPTPSRVEMLPHGPPSSRRASALDDVDPPMPSRIRRGTRERDTASQAGEIVTSEPTDGVSEIDAMVAAASSEHPMLTTLDGQTPDSVQVKLASGNEDDSPPEPPRPTSALATAAPDTPRDGPRAELEPVTGGPHSRAPVAESSPSPASRQPSRADGLGAPGTDAPRGTPGDDEVLELDFEAAGLSRPDALGSMAAYEPVAPEPTEPEASADTPRALLLGRDPIAALLFGLVLSFAISTIAGYEVMRRTERETIMQLEEELADSLSKPLQVQAGKVRPPDTIVAAIDGALDKQRTRFFWVWLGLGLPLGIGLGRIPSPR